MDNPTDGEISLEILSPQSRATAVVVQTVIPERSDEFLEWQRGITRDASLFPGYKYTEVYQPAPDGKDEWVTVVHFESNPLLEAWIKSPVREKWVEDLKKRFGDFTLKRVGGFDAWFSGVEGEAEKIPDWKMVVTVVAALYPTVMILTYWLLTPFIKFLPFPGQMLIGNIASVAFLQWVAMPLLTRRLSFWLRPTKTTGLGITLAGLAGILASLALMLWLFTSVS
jgi:antibiotic biosynthesis monooxygenase (ABM) superfamily enzyme